MRISLSSLSHTADNKSLLFASILCLLTFVVTLLHFIIRIHRASRLAQISQQAKKELYGNLREIRADEWQTEVTKASDTVNVVVLLYNPFPAGSNEHQYAELVSEAIRTLALRHIAVKFVKIRAQDAIANYPEKNCPTILVYSKSDVLMQIVGLDACGGARTSADFLEWRLAEKKIVTTELEEDPLIANRIKINRVGGKTITSGRY